MSRAEQDQLIRWVIAVHDAPIGQVPAPPLMSLDQFAAAGLATGLTALVGTLAEHHGVTIPTEWSHFVDDQRREVAERQQRFVALLPRVLDALDAADVAAIPVKGAVLSPAI